MDQQSQWNAVSRSNASMSPTTAFDPLPGICQEQEQGLILINQAALAVEELEKRVCVVLRPVGPSATERTGNAAARPTTSPLREQALNQNGQLQALIERIRGISDRIDL